MAHGYGGSRKRDERLELRPESVGKNLEFLSTPANKMDDLQTIAFRKRRLWPHFPGHNVSVQFHRNPIFLHAELLNQLRQ